VRAHANGGHPDVGAADAPVSIAKLNILAILLRTIEILGVPDKSAHSVACRIVRSEGMERVAGRVEGFECEPVRGGERICRRHTHRYEVLTPRYSAGRNHPRTADSSSIGLTEARLSASTTVRADVLRLEGALSIGALADQLGNKPLPLADALHFDRD
jgi:hypothetical protein